MILPKGFTVKHGTSIDRLPEIFRNGLIPAAKRNKIRSEEETAPLVSGVYVATIQGYYGASAAFTSRMYEISNTGEIAGDAPIVLNIKLGKDCEILADEDYVCELTSKAHEEKIYTLEQEAERVWQEYGTGVLPNKKIPPSWIDSVEYPVLRDITTINSSQKHSICFDQDIWLMVLAYWQTKTQATTSEYNQMVKEFARGKNYKSNFTNVDKFTESSVKNLLNLNIVKNKERFFTFAMAFWREYTIRLDKLGLEHN